MSLLIVGGDHLGSIEKNVKELGFTNIVHYTGRNKGMLRDFKIPNHAYLVLILTDYIHHTAMKKVKKMAKNSGYQLVFAKRNWSEIHSKLKTHL